MHNVIRAICTQTHTRIQTNVIHAVYITQYILYQCSRKRVQQLKKRKVMFLL